MNREKFYIGVRNRLTKSLSQKQVDCMELILDESIKNELTLEQAAYCFATAWHETGQFKWLREIWGPTAQQKKYEPGTALAKQLGNTQKGDGYKYLGRGFVHITGRRNYIDWASRLGVDIVNTPALAEKPEYAAKILVIGCKLGTFTTKKLSDYINDKKVDFKEARRVVNGTDKAVLIAEHAEKFRDSLKEAEYSFLEAQKPAQSVSKKPSVVVPEKEKTSQTASVWELLADLLFILFTGTKRKK